MKKQIQILIVEDEPVVAADIKFSLQAAGYKVIAVVSAGEDALFLIKEKQPDLIIMDIQLKGQLTGIETAKRINTMMDVPLIYLTAHTDGQTVEEAKTTNPFGFIVKPFEDIELQTSVKMALHKFQADKKVKDSETWLSSTFRSLGDGVIVTDNQLNITYLNPYAVMMTGWLEEEAIGKNLDQVFRIQDENNGRQIIGFAAGVISRGELTELVNKAVLISKDGKDLPVDASIAPIKTDEGNITGVVLVFHDTLDRKLTEVALRESENRYRSLFEESNDAIFIITRKGNFVIANRSMQKMFNFEEFDIADFNILQLFQDKSAWPHIQSMIEMNGSIRDYQTQMATKNGDHLECLITSSMRTSETGQILGFQGIIRDITERMRSEEALRNSESRYRLLAENIVDIIWVMDTNLKFNYVTPSVTSILGYDTEAFLRIDLERLCTEESLTGAVKYFSRFFNEETIPDQSEINVEIELRKAENDGGTVWVNVSSSVFRAEGGEITGIIGVAHDITQRKIAEMEKEMMHEQFLQAQKMEAIGILAGGVAHDFNNLLTVIQGSTDLIMMNVDENDPVYSDLYEINKASIRAAELTSQLLLFSRKKPMRCLPVNLNRIVEDLLKMLHRLIGEDVGISTFLEDDLWQISADRSNMEQVIMNLVVNARDAMPDGGQVTIKSENIVLCSGSEANFPEAVPGNYVCLSLSDKGSGIGESTLQRIFEPFYSTKGTGKGTGLGLSVVYGIVKQHMGWIDVKSRIGEGTTFKLFFPAIFDQETPEIKGDRRPGTVLGEGQTVLLVEDEDGVRQFATRALQAHNYTVISSGTAEDALEMYQKNPKKFDVIVSDVVLPDRNGIELIETILEDQPDMPVLLCSGYTDQKSQWSVIQEKGYMYLQKPYSVNDLLLMVKNILTRVTTSGKNPLYDT